MGEVEQIPENVEQGFDRFGDGIERKWDNAVDDVEDAPENVAGWVGEKVGDVERFGDDVENLRAPRGLSEVALHELTKLDTLAVNKVGMSIR